MINRSNMMVYLGLLLVIVLSVMLYFGINSTIIHVLLAVGFILIGVGIVAGFIKMISEDKN